MWWQNCHLCGGNGPLLALALALALTLALALALTKVTGVDLLLLGDLES